MSCAALFLAVAEWIAGSYVLPVGDAAFFEDAPNDIVIRKFTAKAGVRKAEWRVAAPGMRDLFVNGTRVTSTALSLSLIHI